jgi:hypothetical protein
MEHNRSVAVYPFAFALPMQTSHPSARLRSFGDALRGLGVVLQTQRNATVLCNAIRGFVATGAEALTFEFRRRLSS